MTIHLDSLLPPWLMLKRELVLLSVEEYTYFFVIVSNLFASVQVHSLGARLALNIATPVKLAVASFLDCHFLSVITMI